MRRAVALSTVFSLSLVLMCSARAIKLEDGRFNDIIISISNRIPFNGEIVSNLKLALRSASKYMEVASQINGFGPYSFGYVYILLPDSWDDADVKLLGPKDATWQTHEDSHFRVEPKTTQSGQSKPCKCGEQKLFANLFDQDLLSSTQPGTDALAKNVVREFVKLRYGVFDEINDPSGPHAYIKNGTWVPMACSKTIRGEWRKKGGGKICFVNLNATRLDPDCTFHLSSNQTARGSLMFTSHIPTVDKFCTSHGNSPELEHNADAPNPQNLKCNGSSVASVMLRHPDYQGVSIVPKNNSSPNIVLVKRKRAQRLVIILDVSWSMGVNNDIEKMKSAINMLLMTLTNQGFECGIVTFNATAHVVHPLTLLTKKNEKSFFASINKLTAKGGTNIGLGVLEGLKMLGVDLQKPAKANVGNMILLSDGEDHGTEFPVAIEIAKQTSIVVDVIAFGNKADNKIHQLSHVTSGVANFVHRNKEVNSDFMESSISLFNRFVAEGKQQFLIHASEVRSIFKADVGISAPAGESITIRLSSTNGTSDIQNTDLMVITPSGAVYSHLNTSSYYRDNASGFVTLKINSSVLETGNWIIKSSPSAGSTIVRKRRSTGSSGNLLITITSSNQHILLDVMLVWHLMGQRALDIDNVENNIDHPLRVTAFFESGISLVKANANCTATVHADNTIYVKDLPIRDDGLDPDDKSNDGYYTSFLPPIFFQQQKYTLTVVCTGHTVAGRKSIGFKITGVNANSNSSRPPSIVSDFAIDHHDFGGPTLRLTVTFTAVGAHWLSGTASRYIFTMCSTDQKIPSCYDRLLPSTHIVAARNPVRYEIPDDWKALFNNTFHIWIAAENNYGQLGPRSKFLIAQPFQMKPGSQWPNHSQLSEQGETGELKEIISKKSTSQSTKRTNAKNNEVSLNAKFRAQRHLPWFLLLFWTAWMLG